MKKQIIFFVILIIFLSNTEAFSCINYAENLANQAVLVNKASQLLQNKIKEVSRCSRNRNKNCYLTIKELTKAEKKYLKEKAVYEKLKANPTDTICH